MVFRQLIHREVLSEYLQEQGVELEDSRHPTLGEHAQFAKHARREFVVLDEFPLDSVKFERKAIEKLFPHFRHARTLADLLRGPPILHEKISGMRPGAAQERFLVSAAEKALGKKILNPSAFPTRRSYATSQPKKLYFVHAKGGVALVPLSVPSFATPLSERQMSAYWELLARNSKK